MKYTLTNKKCLSILTLLFSTSAAYSEAESNVTVFDDLNPQLIWIGQANAPTYDSGPLYISYNFQINGINKYDKIAVEDSTHDNTLSKRIDLGRIVMAASEQNFKLSVKQSPDSKWYWIDPSKKVDLNNSVVRAEQLLFQINPNGTAIRFYYKSPETLSYHILLGRWEYSVGALIDGYAEIRDELKMIQKSKGSVVINFSKHPLEDDFLKESPTEKLKAEVE